MFPTHNFHNYKTKEWEPTEHVDAQKLDTNVANPGTIIAKAKTEFN